MKCPNCQAKLLPVDGQMFCLQCGEVCQLAEGEDLTGPEAQDTVDPLLQKALNDGLAWPLAFRTSAQKPLTQAAAEPKRPSMVPIRQFVEARPVLAPADGGTGGSLATEPLSWPHLPVTLIKPARPDDARRFSLTASQPWVIGIAVFLVFFIINMTLATYLRDRVYPGVRIGTVAVGGRPASSLDGLIGALSSKATLAVQVADQSRTFKIADLAGYDVERAKAEAMAVGHNQPLPVIGLVSAWFSRPIPLSYKVKEAAVTKAAAQLAQAADRPAANAWPLAMNGQAVVVAEHPGIQVDQAKLESAIKQGILTQTAVKAVTQEIDPGVKTTDFAADITTAQVILSTSIVVKIRTTTYNLTGSAQVADWIRYNGPGKGASIDASGVAAYVNSLPGSFDRSAMAAAIEQALSAHSALNYQASTRRNTHATGTAVVRPVVQYRYCVEGAAADVAAASPVVVQALSAAGGWTLGGRVQFVAAQQACNFSVALRDVAGLTQLSPACASQTTCRVDNQLAIAQKAWQAPPSWWTADVGSYRVELVNHELGHWLGFDHAACSQPASQPVLGSPAVVLSSGCSPNWYAVPVETQGTKVLAGFQ